MWSKTAQQQIKWPTTNKKANNKFLCADFSTTNILCADFPTTNSYVRKTAQQQIKIPTTNQNGPQQISMWINPNNKYCMCRFPTRNILCGRKRPKTANNKLKSQQQIFYVRNPNKKHSMWVKTAQNGQQQIK